MRTTGPVEESAGNGTGGRAGRGPQEHCHPELRAVLAAARRRASRDAEASVDTAHLLHSLLEYDPACRARLTRADCGTAGAGRPHRAVRVLGYLAQRAIGYGMRWRGVVEESARRAAVPGPGPDRLSPAAAVAWADAVVRSAARGATAVEGSDLLAALAADPGCRAGQVLWAAGVDPRRLALPGPSARVAGSCRGEGPVAS